MASHINKDTVQGGGDIGFLDQTLYMPDDHPRVQQIITTIQKDDSMCFKMKWYLVRYVRRNFIPYLEASEQPWGKRVRNRHSWSYKCIGPDGKIFDRLLDLLDKPLNRLTFEAERAQSKYSFKQPGWQYKRVPQILQRCYEKYDWKAYIDESEVDDILIEAGEDLRVFDAAIKCSAANKRQLFTNSSGTQQPDNMDYSPLTEHHHAHEQQYDQGHSTNDIPEARGHSGSSFDEPENSGLVNRIESFQRRISHLERVNDELMKHNSDLMNENIVLHEKIEVLNYDLKYYQQYSEMAE